MNKKDEEIQRKLQELESAVLNETTIKETPQQLTTPNRSSTELTTSQKQLKTTGPQTSVQNDLCYFGGIGLILTGVFMFFNTVKVGTGMLAMFGTGSGAGLLLVPLMIGIGWLLYDSKSRIPWLITAGSCAIIFFTVLNSLVMSFPTMSLLSMIMMLLPFAAGGALLLKGMGGPKAIEDKLKNSQ